MIRVGNGNVIMLNDNDMWYKYVSEREEKLDEIHKNMFNDDFQMPSATYVTYTDEDESGIRYGIYNEVNKIDNGYLIELGNIIALVQNDKVYDECITYNLHALVTVKEEDETGFGVEVEIQNLKRDNLLDILAKGQCDYSLDFNDNSDTALEIIMTAIQLHTVVNLASPLISEGDNIYSINEQDIKAWVNS